MATKQAIVTQLTQFATVLRHKLTPEELAALSQVWGELFQAVSDQELTCACRMALQRCRFFPVPADVKSTLDELRRQTRQNQPALPPGKPDKVTRWVSAVSGQVCRKSWRDARFKAAANAYFEAGPGMNSRREQLARDILGPEFVEFEKWAEAV